ncbi:hypothetical protein RirG_001080 [Rhizophagus irregularis DAOM 197198w]|uniref:Uncharacterized protein n=1 Tax=Rhizophagus irregularis (strain DAOM 197198w) TaxID=1432141 RepID=A0A015M4I3_RHIIW|nr:hypothetical protein RirG_001080 [Rhizophagus irregularis DAOM 197198w]
MVTHNSSNNFDVNVYYESNSQTTVSQTYDTYCNDVNNMISDQQLMSNTISLDQQLNASSPNHHDANDANDANYQQYNNQQTTIPDQPNVASPNHNQQYQQHDIVSPNSDECDTNYQQHNNAISNYSNNATISPGRQPTSDNNVTTSSDQQPTANSPNHNQQYQRHNVASPNHQQQYVSYVWETVVCEFDS